MKPIIRRKSRPKNYNQQKYVVWYTTIRLLPCLRAAPSAGGGEKKKKGERKEERGKIGSIKITKQEKYKNNGKEVARKKGE